jgi:hypothetical protein
MVDGTTKTETWRAGGRSFVRERWDGWKEKGI